MGSRRNSQSVNNWWTNARSSDNHQHHRSVTARFSDVDNYDHVNALTAPINYVDDLRARAHDDDSRTVHGASRYHVS